MDVWVQWWQESLMPYLPKLVTGIAILVVGWLLARLLRRGLRSVLKRAEVDPTLAGFSTNLTYIVLLTLVVITALHQFGFPALSFAAVIGAAGLAIGLALKGTLSNFAAGVMLITLRPFNVGDHIEAAGVSGVVTQIQVFATRLTVTNEKTVIIPNSAITGGNITNYSTP